VKVVVLESRDISLGKRLTTAVLEQEMATPTQSHPDLFRRLVAMGRIPRARLEVHAGDRDAVGARVFREEELPGSDALVRQQHCLSGANYLHGD